MTTKTEYEKMLARCQAMDLEEQGLNLLESSNYRREEAKAAFKAGHSVVAARLMKAAVTLSTQGYDCLAGSKEIQDAANKL